MTDAQKKLLYGAIIGLIGVMGGIFGKDFYTQAKCSGPADSTVVVTPPIDSSHIPTGKLSGLAFKYDDFTKYANTAALLANVSSNIGGTGNYATVLYNDGYNAQLASIDTSVKYNGHQTLKYTQPGGIANSPALWVYFTSLQHIWLRAKIKFSPGFTTTGTTTQANSYKLLGFAWDTYDGSGRVEITNTTQYQNYWNMITKVGSKGIGGCSSIVLGNITTEWTDNTWYDYILEVDFTGGSTGLDRVWMAKDGNVPVLKGTCKGTLTTGAPMPGLDGVMLGLNFNQTRAATQNQALWYGQWEVVDGTAHPHPFGL